MEIKIINKKYKLVWCIQGRRAALGDTTPIQNAPTI